MRFLPILLAILTMAGCAPPSTTPPSMSSRTKADLAIMAGKVRNGMTPDEVIEALGTPERRSTSQYDPTAESMMYTAGDGGQHVLMVMFRNGKVFKHFHGEGPDKMFTP